MVMASTAHHKAFHSLRIFCGDYTDSRTSFDLQAPSVTPS